MRLRTIAVLCVLSILAIFACNLPTLVSPQGGTPAATLAPTSPPTAESPPAMETASPSTMPAASEMPATERSIAVIVQPELYTGVRAGLQQYELDLLAEGTAMVLTYDELQTPLDVRAWLLEQYQRVGNLEGVLLVGELPYAYQWVTMTYTNPSLSPTAEEAISMQIYADLDGAFLASPGYVSPSGRRFSFDVHEGEMDWEIWVGVLPPYHGDVEGTVEAVNRYFEKNHAYRMGETSIPRNFLQIDEHHKAATLEEVETYLESLRSGQYAWTPFSLNPEAHFYLDGPLADISVDKGYQALSEGVADFFVADVHGTWSWSGQISIDWVEANPVRTVFFWSGGCSVGNLDHPDNFLTAALYSPTSMVLIAAGKTTDAGGMGNNEEGFYGHNIAAALDRGESFGQAILGHVNVPLIYPWSESREFNFATPIFLGDLTLTLQE